MKKILLAFTLLISVAAVADEVAVTNVMDPKHPKHQETMQKFMEFSSPSEAHKVLSKMSGNWKFVMKSWHKADAPADESTGTMKMKMIMGGRFLEQDLTGKMMGQTYKGHGVIGFDNVKKKYNTIWLDNVGTGMNLGTGEFDEKTQTLKDEGEVTCPIKKGRVEYHSEWKLVDKNNLVFSMYGEGLDGGDEFKMMEITFKRAK